MTVATVTALHQVPELHCGYCGRREPLPHDAAQRHQHLRLRLLQLKRARETLEAPLATYRYLEQGLLPGMLLMTAVAAVSLLTHLASGKVTTVALLPVATWLGMGAGWLAMALTFRTLLRPRLRARPPAHPGLAARCRSCGGELPRVTAPKIQCRYCAADNLLDDRASADASELLRREAAEYHARASGGATPDFAQATRAFYICGVVTFVLTALLLEGARRLAELLTHYVDLT